MVSLKQIRC